MMAFCKITKTWTNRGKSKEK